MIVGNHGAIGFMVIHLADGTDSARDEHLVPGRGDQPVSEVLTALAAAANAGQLGGSIIAEVSTRGAASREERVRDLRETLNYARTHLGSRT